MEHQGARGRASHRENTGWIFKSCLSDPIEALSLNRKTTMATKAYSEMIERDKNGTIKEDGKGECVWGAHVNPSTSGILAC